MSQLVVFPDRPFTDGRPTAVFVFNALRTNAGRLTQLWLARVRAFDAAGWATHAVLINRDADLADTVAALQDDGLLPTTTHVHHYALRDRRIRPSWAGPLAPGQTNDSRIGDWLDWLTGQLPGAVVMADSPAAYPYLAAMTNPTVARVAGIHLNHLTTGRRPKPDDAVALGPMAARFAERFEQCHDQFDALVVMTQAQADDLRARFGADTPVVVIPPGVAPPATAPATTSASAPLDAPAEAPRIVSVAPLEERSRHAEAIQALAAIGDDHPDAVLEVVGEGDDGPALLAEAERLGVADRVRVCVPGGDEHEPFLGATVSLWAGRRESCPLAIIRSLQLGVPVVARDVRYGPAELITSPEFGDLFTTVEGMAAALRQRLAQPSDPDLVRRAAEPLLRRIDPARVGAQWVKLAGRLAAAACDHRTPTLLVDAPASGEPVLRLHGVLVNCATQMDRWKLDLPDPGPSAGVLSLPYWRDDDLPVHTSGRQRDVVARLETARLASAAVRWGQPFSLTFTDQGTTIPLLTPGFAERIIASRTGTATLSHNPDGSVRVAPRPELLRAANVDGRLLVRSSPELPPSDVTHAAAWDIDVDWASLHATPTGAAFTGTLRATGIVPAEDSAPAVCVTDVGGYSRAIGTVRYTGEPVIDGLTWSVSVAGDVELEALIRTTQLARRALALHVGYRGLLLPIGGLWTQERREPFQLASDAATVTIVRGRRGRVLAAPGQGYRARVSGAVLATRDRVPSLRGRGYRAQLSRVVPDSLRRG